MRPAIRVWGVFLSALALAACGERAASPVRSPKEGDAMTTPATTDRRALLPLDGAAPSKLETATFALG